MYEPLDFETAVSFTRENTGKALCDSGDYYGRHWQQPAPKADIIERPENTDPDQYCDFCDASINTTALLVQLFEQHVEFTEEYDDFANREEHEYTSHFELIEAFLENKGYHQVARDNTYNSENDLTQQFVYAVWRHENAEGRGDWLYNRGRDTHEDTPDYIVIVHVHTGCDVRGGYSRPLIGKFEGDYTVPFDLKVEWYIDGDSELAEEVNNSGYYTNGYGCRPDDDFTPLYWNNGMLMCCQSDVDKEEALADEALQYALVPSEPYWGE
jgi:hypothetical protein